MTSASLRSLSGLTQGHSPSQLSSAQDLQLSVAQDVQPQAHKDTGSLLKTSTLPGCSYTVCSLAFVMPLTLGSILCLPSNHFNSLGHKVPVHLSYMHFPIVWFLEIILEILAASCQVCHSTSQKYTHCSPNCWIICIMTMLLALPGFNIFPIASYPQNRDFQISVLGRIISKKPYTIMTLSRHYLFAKAIAC